MEKHIKKIISLILIVSPSVFASNDLSISTIYANGRFDEAYFLFKNLAQIGNKDAQFNLGVMHYKGQHVARNKALGYAWMKLAAKGGKQNYKTASDNIFNTFTREEKESASRELLNLQKVYSLKTLQTSLSPNFISDSDPDFNVEPSLIREPQALYPKSAANVSKMGYVKVEYNVSPEGLSRDIKVLAATNGLFVLPTIRAVKRALWEPVTSKSGKPTVYRNGTYHFIYTVYGTDFQLSGMKRELKKYKKKAEKGDAMAQYKYARTLLKLRDFHDYQKGMTIEYRDINEWFLKSAFQGNRFAQYWLGKHMIRGVGCKADFLTGMKWLKASASAGYSEAQIELAMNLSEGDTNQLTENRVYWLRKAVAANNNIAKLYLAWELSTSTNYTEQAGREAEKLLENIDFENYYDKVRVYETKAAMYASLRLFDKAIENQLLAIEEAKVFVWHSPILERRLEYYKNGKRWGGSYHLL